MFLHICWWNIIIFFLIFNKKNYIISILWFFRRQGDMTSIFLVIAQFRIRLLLGFCMLLYQYYYYLLFISDFRMNFNCFYITSRCWNVKFAATHLSLFLHDLIKIEGEIKKNWNIRRGLILRKLKMIFVIYSFHISLFSYKFNTEILLNQ